MSLWGQHIALLLMLEFEVVKLNKVIKLDKLRYIEKPKNWFDCSFTPFKLIHSSLQGTAGHRRLGGKGPSKFLHLTITSTMKVTEIQKQRTG